MSARWLSEAQVEAFKRKRAGQLSAVNASISPGRRPFSPAVRSNLEGELQRQLEASDLPPAQFDVAYLVGSRCRADVLFQAQRLVVEIQGGCHVLRAKAHADIRKAAESLLQGYRLLTVDKDAIRSGDAIRWITELLK
jgi:very-short-patch-repair endonuclease